MTGTLDDKLWQGHEALHVLSDKVRDNEHRALTDLAAAWETAHNKLHDVHEAAHEREHQATEQAFAKAETASSEAIGKAETATDKRFSSVNEFREQLRDQAGRLATKDTVETLNKEMDRRFEDASKEYLRRFSDLQAAIVLIEKADVKGEGKQIGRNTMVAVIVTAITIVGTILGIVITIANLATQ